MGQKDMAEKLLEEYNDVFADIVNVLLFKGKLIIQEDSLKETKAKSQYKAETGILHEQERDVVKYWEEGNVRVAICGLENQTADEKYMPLRLIGYDGASYRQQLLAENPKNTIVPVVTLVLHFGLTEWSYPYNLKSVIDVPDALDPYVNDYKANIFNIAFLDDETVKMFKSDFRHVAEHFVKLRKGDDYVPSKEKIKHVDAFLKFLHAITGDSRYEIEFLPEELEEGVSMCELLEKVEQKGIAIGKEEGITIGKEEGITIGKEEGIAIGKNELIHNALMSGMEPNMVKQILRVSDEEIEAALHFAEEQKN